MSTQSLAPAQKTQVAVTRGENPIRDLQYDVNRLFNDFFGDLEFPAFERLFNRGFPATVSRTAPAIDLREDDKAYTLVAEVPGMHAKDIQVSAANGCITLSGEKMEKAETRDKDYIRQECSYGSFKRVVALPPDADIEAVSAEMKDGLLSLTVAKKTDDKTKSHKVSIREVA